MANIKAHRTLPPSDGSVMFENIVDFHLDHNPKHTWAILAGIDGAPPVSISYKQLAYAVHRAAHILNPNGQVPQGTRIAILVSADTIVYIALILGAMKAGLVPFPLSPRTQVAGMSHLLLSTHTKYMVFGGSPVIDDLWGKVKILSEAEFNATRLPPSSELYPYLNGKDDLSLSITRFPNVSPTTSNSLVAILHSSGSTGLPRPVEIYQESVLISLVQQSAAWECANIGEPVGLMALPTFHMAGFAVQCVWPLFTGYCPVFLPPSPVPMVPTAEIVMKALISAHCVSIVTVPTFLEIWMHDSDAIAHLKSLRGVYFGGGPLAHWIGDSLASKGVPLRSAYGVTELGCISRFQSPSYKQGDAQNWIYLEFSKQAKCHFVPQSEDEGTYELVVVSCAEHKPLVINCEIDGQPAYATKDLMAPHPSIPSLWKIIGRLDDQIVFLNGEKVNPGGIEDEIIKSPLVEVATMFGRERNQAGLLIELVKTAHTRLHSKESRAQLLDEIWPFIDKANGVAPTHARLSRDAVIFADPDRPLPRTPKGTLARSATLNTYAEDIDGMYAAFERGNNTEGSLSTLAPSSTRSQIEEWLKTWLEKLLGTNVDVGVDLFQQGLDSLTATFLFRELKKSLGSSSALEYQQAARELVQETIFRNPTISQLSQLVIQPVATEAATLPEKTLEENMKSIQQFIQQYDRTPNVQAPLAPRSPPMEHVVVTGTTGGLGSHLLAQLLAHDRVERVWALNRKSSAISQSVEQRQLDSFKDKLLDVDLLRHPKLVLLDSDLTEERLGVPSGVYAEILRTSTLIIHNAWQVNFNLSLQSFEPSIRGARNLLDLALASESQPRFVFTSSVSAAGFGSPGRQLIETTLTPLDASTSIGYGQSKFVTEKLLETSRTSGLETCSIRLGQLVGDTIGGAWSLTDWVPSMIASSVSSGYLPDAVGSVSWIPIDVAARSIIDLSFNRSTLLPSILHCAHPLPTSWKQIISSFAVALASRNKDNRPLPIVPFSEWLSYVNTSAASYGNLANEMVKRFPSIKIHSTIEAMVRADEELRRMKPEDLRNGAEGIEVGGIARLLTMKAVSLSCTLKNVSPLDQEDVSRWVGYWAERGLFV